MQRNLQLTKSLNDEVYNKFTMNIGSFVGTIDIDDVTITLEGSNENLVPNSTFEDYRILRPAGSVQVNGCNW